MTDDQRTPLTVTCTQLAALLGISTDALAVMRKQGQMPIPAAVGFGRPRFVLQRVAVWLGFDHVPANLGDLRLVSTTEVAKILGISRTTAYRRANDICGAARVMVGTESRYVVGRIALLNALVA